MSAVDTLTTKMSTSTITDTVANKSADSAKPKKQKKTVYWGIELPNDLFDNEKIKSFLDDHKELIGLPFNSTKKKGIHSTLKYFKKDEDLSVYDECEAYYSLLEGKECILTIPRFGYSDNALALDVESIKCDETDVKSYATHKQHVTMALKEGVFAVDSVKTLLGEGTLVEFDTPLTVQGKLKRFFF